MPRHVRAVARPSTVDRSPLLSKALANGKTRIQALCAPIGSGKSSLLNDYVRASTHASVLQISPASGTPELVSGLHALADVREIIIDDADRLRPDVLNTLLDLAQRDPLGRTFVLAGTSRSRLHIHALLARGGAELLDGSAFAFGHDDIIALASEYGVEAEAADVAQFLRDTGGWPIAVAWVLREAANSDVPLSAAFDAWVEQCGHLFLEFIEKETLKSDASRAALGRALYAASASDVQLQLSVLEADGYPVVRTGSMLRLHRVIELIARGATSRNTVDAPIFSLQLFDRARCGVAGAPVQFRRRRDRAVLMYVALAPDARVTRAELMRAFWAGASAVVASQGLRTTLSHLRHGIAQASGHAADVYLETGETIALNLDHVTVDARRFMQHVEHGHADDQRGDTRGVMQHFSAAARLFGTGLFNHDIAEPAFASSIAEYAEHFARIAARLTELQGRPVLAERRRSDRGGSDPTRHLQPA